MKLPNLQAAVVAPEKIRGYLLSFTNPRNQYKSGFFTRFGFDEDNLQEFIDALIRHAANNEVVDIVDTQYGPRYHVDGPIETPDGRNPRIRTVWQVDGGTDYPRFITAFPSRR